MPSEVSFRLDWNGTATFAEIVSGIEEGLTEFGLRLEAPAKAPLKPGKGVLTGTYRRSLHAASPSYDFGQDDEIPSNGTPERGGTGGGAEREGMQVKMNFGSGLRYAGAVESRYGTIATAHAALFPTLPDILEKHMP